MASTVSNATPAASAPTSSAAPKEDTKPKTAEAAEKPPEKPIVQEESAKQEAVKAAQHVLSDRRPSIEDLSKQNIYKEGGVLAAQRQQLERSMLSDSLSKKLEKASSPEELEQRGIAVGGGIAPALQSTARSLERNIIRDRLSFHQQERPSIEEIDPSILNTKVAPSLQATQRQLERNMTKSALYHALSRRKSRDDLIAQHILPPDGLEDAEEEQEEAARPSRQASRSRHFVLTRILLKFVAQLAESGEISLKQKGFLKDLIVDQHPVVLGAAELFEADGDLDEFKDTLLRAASDKNMSAE